MKFENTGKVMLFPYSEAMAPILRFRELLEMDIISAASFKSWGYDGRDPLLINGEKPSGLLVSADLDGELSKADTVLLGSFDEYYGDEAIREKYIKKIFEAGKNIISLEHGQEQASIHYKKEFGAAGLKYITLTPDFQFPINSDPLGIPVIGIFGFEEDCGKLELQLLAAKGLRDIGYKVSLISPNTIISLFEGNTYPGFILGDMMGEQQKVKAFLSYANYIVQSEEADILLISCPYGMNNFGDIEISSKYNGLLSHIIIEAIRPDINLFCINGGRNMGWLKRSMDTLELLSAAPTLAASSRRMIKKPTTNLDRLDFKIKTGLMDDEMFAVLTQSIEEETGLPLLDQDYLDSSSLADMILDRLDASFDLVSFI